MNRNLSAALSLAAVAATAAAAAAALILPRNALAAGDMTAGDITIDPAPFVGTRTRAEYEAARDEVQALTGEDSGSSYLRMHSPARPATSTMGAPAQ